MHVHVEAVKVLEGSRDFVILREDESCAGECGVDMDPEVWVVLQHGDYGSEIINSAGGGGAEGYSQEEGM